MAGFLIGPDPDEQGNFSTDNPSKSLGYSVLDTEDPTEVAALLAAGVPAEYGGLPLTEINYSHQGSLVWKGKATYGKREPMTLGAKRLRGTTKGGTAHRTHSISTLGTFLAPGVAAAPNFRNAINVRDGKAEGVDYTVPAFSFSIEMKRNPATTPSNYLELLWFLTGTYNDVTVVITYRGKTLTFEAGELLFKGADFDFPSDGEESYTYEFEAEPNVTDLEVGPIGPISKIGWGLLWAYSENVADGGTVVPVPRAVFIEKIYPRADDRGVSFDDFGGF